MWWLLLKLVRPLLPVALLAAGALGIAVSLGLADLGTFGLDGFDVLTSFL